MIWAMTSAMGRTVSRISTRMGATAYGRQKCDFVAFVQHRVFGCVLAIDRHCQCAPGKHFIRRALGENAYQGGYIGAFGEVEGLACAAEGFFEDSEEKDLKLHLAILPTGEGRPRRLPLRRQPAS